MYLLQNTTTNQGQRKAASQSFSCFPPFCQSPYQAANTYNKTNNRAIDYFTLHFKPIFFGTAILNYNYFVIIYLIKNFSQLRLETAGNCKNTTERMADEDTFSGT